ncbi:uncharacterized protein BT62DRAFT_51766 [Guyanagaster necrorhizus]|uniref:DUF6535 domain-containing protein n=1 Tax=Guyanagaster necrorhizus TaxID=856835 RepID=A0A9P7W6K1_9AGAR|nr:uncharacterized protein BT62DRAFT_51766 [Guyanagaster necrorhizus MCA 3950]KAG7453209.1 hypothetical protein BT62DRAFT_51766 [Guyanagaster necrorhizus MCA 3950]
MAVKIEFRPPTVHGPVYTVPVFYYMYWYCGHPYSIDFDAEMFAGARDMIDILLVFTGLFSAVLVQTSQNTQPDYNQTSALLEFAKLLCRMDRSPLSYFLSLIRPFCPYNVSLTFHARCPNRFLNDALLCHPWLHSLRSKEHLHRQRHQGWRGDYSFVLGIMSIERDLKHLETSSQ